jgi:hypothetical protein
MYLRICFILSLIFACNTYGQDTTFVKSFYGGSKALVPAKKTWKIEKAYITSGDGYNIAIQTTNFKASYAENEEIQFPYYIAEMELLDKKDMVSYIVYIRESASKP